MRANSESCRERGEHRVSEFLYGEGCLKCGYWKWNERYEKEREQDLRETSEWIAAGCRD